MGVSKVIYNGNTLLDLTADTVAAANLLKGFTAHDKAGNAITGTAEQSGGGLPSGIAKLAFGTDTITTAFTTTRRTVTHNLGVVPDLVLYWHSGNIAQTYTMMWALRCPKMGYRSSAYDNYYCYHGNNTTQVTITNSNSSTYGVSNLTATTFQLASSSSSYYWRADTYNWIAVKFE